MFDLLVSYYILLIANLKEAIKKTIREVKELTEAYIVQ